MKDSIKKHAIGGALVFLFRNEGVTDPGEVF
jgi:hypothetical protein